MSCFLKAWVLVQNIEFNYTIPNLHFIKGLWVHFLIIFLLFLHCIRKKWSFKYLDNSFRNIVAELTHYLIWGLCLEVFHVSKIMKFPCISWAQKSTYLFRNALRKITNLKNSRMNGRSYWSLMHMTKVRKLNFIWKIFCIWYF